MKILPTSSIPEYPRRRIAMLCLLALIAALMSLCFGAVSVAPGEIWKILTGELRGTPEARIILYSRLPRTLGCLLAGAALAVSGAVIQGVLHNPLAAPNVIGVNSGAGLMVALCCAVNPTAVKAIPFAAFLGALVAALLIFSIAERTGASRMTLVLAGIAISGMFGAGIDAVVTVFPDALNGYSDFRIGGFNNLAMSRIIPASWVILAALLGTFLLSGGLDLLALGAETAHALGLPVRRVRFLLLACAAALAGAAGFRGAYRASYDASPGGGGESFPAVCLRLWRGILGNVLRPCRQDPVCSLCAAGGHCVVPPWRRILHLAFDPAERRYPWLS